MLNKQPTLYFYRGTTSSLEFDFSSFIFQPNGKCVFTISSIYENNELLQFEFKESKKYVMLISDEFTSKLKDNKYYYNIIYEVDGERYPQCANSDIIVKDIINGTRD